MTDNSDFKMPKDGYAAFDALTLRNLIVDRLNQSRVFTDQNYQGSNISTIIEIIAYSYHTLLFYLNQTSSESQFSQASLYENINKIVKVLNYNPLGMQTATLPFQSVGSGELASGSYTIPRYSYFTANGVSYTFNEDVTFFKNTSGVEILSDLSNQSLLYQGKTVEYPSYVSMGEPYEQITITAVDKEGVNSSIDHFNIDIYVKDNSKIVPAFELYQPTESLFLEDFAAKKYEIRLNENGRYEVKFGNNIFGKQLNANDEVAIYYLQTDRQRGEVDVDSLNGSILLFYTSDRFNTILNDTLSNRLTRLTIADSNKIAFSNSDPSTQFRDIESVQSIKDNALNTFKTQFRLLATKDYETFVKKNFGGIMSSVKAVNNKDFINGHLKYYFDLGVEKPSAESRVLLNQVSFGSSVSFNNVYVYTVPRFQKVTSLTSRLNYLNQSQKQLISNEIAPYKLANSEVVLMDPIYVVTDFGVKDAGEKLLATIGDESYLQIIANGASRRNFERIQKDVANIFTEYFKTTDDNLGLLVDINFLSAQVLNVEGVVDFKTVRSNNNFTISFPGLSLLMHNPVYPVADIRIVEQNIQLPYFKYPILADLSTFVNKIRVISNE